MWPFPYCNNPLPQSYNNALSIYELLCQMNDKLNRVDVNQIQELVQRELDELKREFNNFNPINAMLTSWNDIGSLSKLVAGNSVISPEGMLYTVANGNAPLPKLQINNSLYLKRNPCPIAYMSEIKNRYNEIYDAESNYIISEGITAIFNNQTVSIYRPISAMIFGGTLDFTTRKQPQVTAFGCIIMNLQAEIANLYSCELTSALIVDGTLTNCSGVVTITRGRIDNGNFQSITVNGRGELNHVTCPIITVDGNVNLSGCVLQALKTSEGTSNWYLNITNCSFTSTVELPAMNIPRVQHLNITNTILNSKYSGIEITVGTCSAVFSNFVVIGAQSDIITMGQYSKLTLLGCTSNKTWCSDVTAAQLNSTPTT